jgi:hypothetical protein
MDDQKLVAFLDGKLAASDFQKHLKPEVEQWVSKLSERGRSASVHLSGSGQLAALTPRQLARILDALISTEMAPAAFLYALDALLMSPRVSWPIFQLRGYMESLSNPENALAVDMALAIKVRKKISSDFLKQ